MLATMRVIGPEAVEPKPWMTQIIAAYDRLGP
jgi:hypothetical protein